MFPAVNALKGQNRLRSYSYSALSGRESRLLSLTQGVALGYVIWLLRSETVDSLSPWKRCAQGVRDRTLTEGGWDSAVAKCLSPCHHLEPPARVLARNLSLGAIAMVTRTSLIALPFVVGMIA